ncbi:MAG: 50S ribosomal protein L1 [Omnitrophica WOR_2 bacterium GWA2_47_8]|nr:MAG: 50S ribosomal protein L1 [Omnitrophica WOR_2 bacterium GWA2_47_8]
MIKVKSSKRMKEASKLVDPAKTYPLDEAMAAVTSFPKTKFDETIELHFHLNVDPKATDQGVRGTVVLPHGTGKKVRILVIAKGEQVQSAQSLGVEHAGGQDLIEKISKGFMDFDCVIATPEMMRDLSKLGKILGPRGLMPSPKSGTVTVDIERAVKDVRAGKIEYKTDKQSGIHVGIGKKSFTKDQLVNNAKQIIDSVVQARPGSVKTEYIKSVFVSSTMGPSLRISV